MTTLIRALLAFLVCASPAWAQHDHSRLANGDNTAFLSLQTDGNLVLYQLLPDGAECPLGRQAGVFCAVWASNTPFPPADPDPPPVPNDCATGDRVGPVRFERLAFTDDRGAFNGVGATLMWGLWGARNQPERLANNLQFLCERSVNYVRILTVVGTDYWAGRKIDTRWPDYFVAFDRLFDLATARGIRLQVTIFGDVIEFMRTQEERRAWVDRMAAYLEPRWRAGQVQFVEMANESTGIGLPAGDLAELTDRWARLSEIPVAPAHVYDTDGDLPSGGVNGLVNLFTAYPDLQADAITPHYRREEGRDGYDPAIQAWESQFWDAVPGGPVLNNEPAGCGASVLSVCTTGPVVGDFVNSLISGNAGYVWHVDADVRGDRDFWQQENAEGQLFALRAMAALLPPGIANGERCNHHWDCHPYEDLDQIWDESNAPTGVLRAFAAWWDGRAYVYVTAMRQRYEIQAKRAMVVEVFDARDGTLLEVATLAAGQRHTFFQNGDGRDFLHRVSPR